MQSRQKIIIFAKKKRKINLAKNLTFVFCYDSKVKNSKNSKFWDHNFNSAKIFENWLLLSFPGVEQSKFRILAKNLNTVKILAFA